MAKSKPTSDRAYPMVRYNDDGSVQFDPEFLADYAAMMMSFQDQHNAVVMKDPRKIAAGDLEQHRRAIETAQTAQTQLQRMIDLLSKPVDRTVFERNREAWLAATVGDKQKNDTPTDEVDLGNPVA